MKLFDSHFHYYGDQSFRAFMSRLDRENEYTLMCVGGDYAESCRARDLAGDFDNVFFAAGIHPHAAESCRVGMAFFGELVSDEKFKAVGELGLDYFYDNSERTVQRAVLEKFLGMALEWDKPVILHCRDAEGRQDAYADMLAVVKDFTASGGRFSVHCYTGSAEYAEKFLGLGGYIGVTGMITFKRAENIRELQKMIPDDRLLIETDSPYLAPVPHRGEDNHPAFLPLIAAKTAEVRGISPEMLADMTWRNACRFFGIGSGS